jgi:hypothetical protein
VGIGHYYLQFPLDVTILAYIAVQMTAIAVQMTTPGLAPAPQAQPPERDFYVVTNESYRWDPTTSVVRPRTAKSEFAGTINAYDTLAAAEMKYRQLEAEHSPLDLEGHDLSYHERGGYDEEETRLWIVYAHSKTEAHDKVFYDDSRNRLGHDGRTDDLLLVTNNEPRRKQYLNWWSPLYRAALDAERQEIEAKMTYGAAIALFGLKELPLLPDSIRCEVVEKLYAELRAKSKELEAAATTNGKAPAPTAKNIDWKARTTIRAAEALISRRISDARACGKDGQACTIHVPKPAVGAI